MIDFIKSTIDKITKSTGSQLVYGESIVIKDRIIIPVAKISYGFGGRLGKHENKTKDENQIDNNKNGNGVMGGLGLKAEPVGVIEIGEFGTRFISFNQTKKMLGLFVGGLVLGGLLLGRKKK